MNWVNQLRNKYEEQFAKIPRPTFKDENYRRTSLKDVSYDRQPGQAVSLGDENYSELLKEFEGFSYLVCNSQKIVQRSGSVPEGVYFSDIQSALKDNSELLREHLELPAIFKTDLFANLAAARWQNGIFLYVPKGKKVEVPLAGIQVADGKEIFVHRTLIVLDEGAEATYVDHFTHSSPFIGGLVQVVAKPNAKFHYGQVQDWTGSAHHFLRQHFLAHRDADIDVTSISLGGQKSQVRTEGECVGSGAHIDMQGGVRGDHKQHFDFWASMNHAVPHTGSNLEYRCVVGDQARAIFQGNVVITPEGKQTEATQQNRGLLLSPKANVESIPQLEIATDEVKCAHGATVSPIDQDQIYYLNSRGIGRSEAESMLINAFTVPVVNRLPGQTYRDWVSTKMESKNEL